MDLNRFRTDETAEIEGVWHKIGEGAELLVARLGNPSYQRRLRELLKPHRGAARTGSVSDELLLELQIQAESETILLDWKGLYEGEKALTYSHKKAAEVLGSLRDFRALVLDLASAADHYRADRLGEAEGN